MKYRLLAVGLAVVLSSAAQAGVVSTIDFQAEATAGNLGPDPAGNDQAAFLIDDVAGPVAAVSASATRLDLEPDPLGLAEARGVAEILPDRLSFAQSAQGFGEHTASARTQVSQVITNDAAAVVNGTFVGQILPGGLLLQVNDNQALANFNASASLSVNISLDGLDLFSFSASIDTSSNDPNANQTLNNMDFLNPVREGADFFSTIFWENVTPLELDLGAFAAGQSKTLTIDVVTEVAGLDGCFNLANCPRTLVSFGDPPDFGYGSVMLFSLYLPPEAVPEPGPLTLLGLGALLLIGAGFWRRRQR